MNTATDPESATPSLAEDEAVLATIGANNKPRMRTTNTNAARKLSTVGQMYDINNDGELDEAEQQMRDMDQSNRGYLTNDKVYSMMKAQIDVQNQLFRTRRVMFVLLALVVILAISNLGTSFAAAHLAKDTTANSNEQLTHKSTGETLSTQTTEEIIQLVRATMDQDDNDNDNNDNGRLRRKLCSEDAENCTNMKTKSFLSLHKNDCKRMFKKCDLGNSVSLSYTWPNGVVSKFNACPYTSGNADEFGQTRFTNQEMKSFYVEKDDDGHCELHGDALRQAEREVCLGDDDCYNTYATNSNAGNSLVCVKLDFLVDRCKNMCDRRRFAPHKQEECKIRCDTTTCQKSELVEGEE